MAHVTHEVAVDLEVELYSCTDSAGDNVDCDFEVDNDLDVTIDIDGFVITADEKELLERAQELTDDDWDIIATQQLIDP